MSSELAGVVGCTEPRLWTPPLRELTPETSTGFDVIDFARDVLDHPLDPWQEWAVIHAGELLPDDRPRFRRVLILVARQNGKTELLVVLTLYWLFVERFAMVLGTSTKLDYAKESWRKACRLAKRVPELAAEVPAKGGIRRANGEQELWRADPDEYVLEEGSRYKIAPSNEEGGRSLTIDRLVLDELRHHYNYEAYDASEPATTAAPDGGQVWAITNAGSDRSVVLNEMRGEAFACIEDGDGDQRLGLFEWSAPEGASPVDVDALRQANPNLGIRKNAADLVVAGAAAMRTGGKKLAGFKTEQMCIHVPQMDPAIDPAGWADCEEPGDLAGARNIGLVLDVSLDEMHVALVAAAQLADGRVRGKAVAAWDGPNCTAIARRALPPIAEVIRPRKFGWFPNGPTAALAAVLRGDWAPEGCEVEEIRSDVPAVCMGLAELVRARQFVHGGDQLLTTHATGAQKLWQGDRWVFTRKGVGHVNGAYALAGAVHLARTMPPPPEDLDEVGVH